MKNKECCGIKMSDFSFILSLGRKKTHFYCTKCGSHTYGNKHYTGDEWFFYINGTTYSEYIKNEKERTA